MRTNSKPVQPKPTTTTTTSKPQSKAPSQVQSKKVEVQKVIIKSEGDDIKDAFELFDANDGKINAREIRMAMQNIGFDEKNPGVYEVMTELDNPRNKNLGGASFNDFCQTVNNRIPERETTEDLRKVFNLFLDDPNATTTSLASRSLSSFTYFFVKRLLVGHTSSGSCLLASSLMNSSS